MQSAAVTTGVPIIAPRMTGGFATLVVQMSLATSLKRGGSRCPHG
jgi:hypothetical protein